MKQKRLILILVLIAIGINFLFARSANTPRLGQEVTPEEVAARDISIFPDGEIIDFELAGEDILALVRIPGAAAPGTSTPRAPRSTRAGRRRERCGRPAGRSQTRER